MNNTADVWGGGIWVAQGSQLIVRNSIIRGNRAGQSGNNIYDALANPDIRYSNIGGSWIGVGNIDKDPLFVDPDKGDFHLKRFSPCIDSGTTDIRLPLYDFEGDPRIAGLAPDMGVDEFYTHLYTLSEPVPGGDLHLRLIGAPDTAPVGLFASQGFLDAPLNTSFGPWNLEFPLFGPFLQPSIPGNGVLSIHGRIPSRISTPYNLGFQALVGKEFTNPCMLNIE